MNAKEFEALAPSLSEIKHYDLINGELIVTEIGTMLTSVISMRIGASVTGYVMEHDTGHTTSARGGYQLSEDTVLLPKMGYIAYDKPFDERNVFFVPYAPDIALEVIAPTDDIDHIYRKVELYLKHGTQIVWVVHPNEHKLVVCRWLNDEAQKEILHEDDMLRGDDVLPDFTLSLQKVFARRNKTDSDQ